jgi:hypothetical protein
MSKWFTILNVFRQQIPPLHPQGAHNEQLGSYRQLVLGVAPLGTVYPPPSHKHLCQVVNCDQRNPEVTPKDRAAITWLDKSVRYLRFTGLLDPNISVMVGTYKMTAWVVRPARTIGLIYYLPRYYWATTCHATRHSQSFREPASSSLQPLIVQWKHPYWIYFTPTQLSFPEVFEIASIQRTVQIQHV